MSEPNNIDPIRRPDEFPSRTEAILSDAIGLEGYEIEPPRSRIEKLLIEFVGVLGASIEVTMDENFVLSAKLLNKDGDTLGTVQTIDLPIEATVVDGRYDSTNKKLILELQNGNTIDIPIADLINGLQEEITAQNPLDADLVDDSTATHKFTTASDISKLAGIEAQANKTVVDSSITDSGTNPVTGGSIYTALSGKQSTIDSSHKLSADLVDDLNATNKFVTASDKTNWNNKQDTIDFSHKLSADLVDDSNTTHKFATAAQLSQISTNETNISSLQEQVGYAITELQGVL